MNYHAVGHGWTTACVGIAANGWESADKKKIEEANKERKDFFNKNEERFQSYADGFYVNMIVDGIVAQKQLGIYAQ